MTIVANVIRWSLPHDFTNKIIYVHTEKKDFIFWHVKWLSRHNYQQIFEWMQSRYSANFIKKDSCNEHIY